MISGSRSVASWRYATSTEDQGGDGEDEDCDRPPGGELDPASWQRLPASSWGRESLALGLRSSPSALPHPLEPLLDLVVREAPLSHPCGGCAWTCSGSSKSTRFRRSRPGPPRTFHASGARLRYRGRGPPGPVVPPPTAVEPRREKSRWAGPPRRRLATSWLIPPRSVSP